MNVIEISEKEFDEKVKKLKGKVLIDCYADWCGPCKMLSPVIDDIASNHENCDFYKINIETAPEIARKYEIMSIPTLLYFENCQLKEKSVGLISKAQLEELINS